MSQRELTFPGSPLTGTDMLGDIQEMVAALASNRSGTSRPSDIQTGEIWLDTTTSTAQLLKFWDGADDITLATINATTNAVTFTGTATSGANSNITSLSGLTTPISVAQGGTGGTTALGTAAYEDVATGGSGDLLRADGDGSQLTGIVSGGSACVGLFSNLRGSTTGLSAVVSITADELVVEDSSNAYMTLRGVSVTLSLATSGENGLDTGTRAASTWYSVWVIAKADGTTAGLLSLSDTTPTLPAGYTFKARTGWVRTDSTANKYPLAFKQIGKSVRYIVAPGTNVTVLPILASGTIGSITTPTYVQTSVAAHVPATASAICISGGTQAPADTYCLLVAPNGNYGALYSTTNPAHLFVDSGTGSGAVIPYTMVLESMNVFVAGVACIITCRGWEDNI